MPLTSGNRLGPYEILSPLGAGGMGEVYRARDTKLGREVALKVLPAEFAQDADRMARFQREAQVLASLNHPNIASIYGLEESGSTRALVMELVEGQTLAERITRIVAPDGAPGSALAAPPAVVSRKTKGAGEDTGATTGAHGAPLQLDEALGIAKQIAEALEFAHERGIIHRDLKPANVKVTHDGAVKVLDFGLAKALDVGAIHELPLQNSPTHSPTLSIAATQAGMILGTAAYMSPEQAKGKTVDRRADIWAFGCVLYEMLTGKRTFEGETTSDVLAAVIRAEPDWSAVPESVPESIRKLLRRCLQKDPKQRLRDIGDARIAIEETMSGEDFVAPVSAPATGGDRRSPLQRALPWLAGLIVGALVSGFVVWKLVSRTSGAAAMHFSAITNFAGVQAQPALSPDGRSVAFVSNRDGHYNIYVGLVSGGSLVKITNDDKLKARPCWSPNGSTIVYAQLNASGIWDIWEAPALGGNSRRLILNAADPAWSPDGHSLAYENTATGALWVSDPSGQNARQVAPSEAPGLQYMEPRFSPDGRELAFSATRGGPYAELEVADVASGKVRQLTHDNMMALSPAWLPDGRSIYFASSRGGAINIWKIAATGGEPEQITAGQGDDAQLDVSTDGKLIVFSTFRENINIAQLDLEATPGPQSPKLLTTDPARNQLGPVYSPDGKRLAYFSNLKGVERENIWVTDADGSNSVQVVQDRRINVFPQWVPDNQHLVYISRSQVAPGLNYDYRSVPVSGGAPRTLFKDAKDLHFDVGPDGRVLFRSFKGDVQAFDPRDNKTETLATLPASEKWSHLRWSPDGRSIAYLVDSNQENDANAGLWRDDFKSPPRQIFRGWVVWYARGPKDEIYLLQGKPDLNGVLWKVGWNGQNLTRLPTTIPLRYSYWTPLPDVVFDVSPDGRYLAVETQGVLQANIGMIENPR